MSCAPCIRSLGAVSAIFWSMPPMTGIGLVVLAVGLPTYWAVNALGRRFLRAGSGP